MSKYNMGSKKHAYVLMVDKIGWDSLSRISTGIDNEYMRTYEDLPEFDVPKGALVEVDPDSLDFQVSVNVICLDDASKLQPKKPQRRVSGGSAKLIKLSVIFKELTPIEDMEYELFVPLEPSSRYKILTTKSLHDIVTCKVGQMVKFSPKPFGWTERSLFGIIQYVGPIKKGRSSNYSCVKEKEYPGVWIGVELLDRNYGDCNGYINGRRYFSAPPLGAVFTTIDHLKLVTENESLTITSPKSATVVNEKRPGKVNTPHKAYSSLPNQRTRERDTKQSNQGKSFKQAESKSLRTCQIRMGERIVWLTDYGPQYGTVKWIGEKNGKILAGVEFENSIGSDDGQGLFSAKPGHAELIPVDCLLKANDFNDNNLQKTPEEIRKSVNSYASNASNSSPRISGSLGRRNISPMGSVENEVSWSNRVSSDNYRVFSSTYDSREYDEDGTSPLGGPSTFDDLNVIRSSASADDEVSNAVERCRITAGSVSQKSSSLNRPKKTQNQPYAPDYYPANADVHDSFEKEEKHTNDAIFSDHRQKFDQLFVDPTDPELSGQIGLIDVGSLVELHVSKIPYFGVVRWLGKLPPSEFTENSDEMMAGIEMEDEIPGGTNGLHFGNHLFECPPSKGVIVPFTHFRPDRRFEHANGKTTPPEISQKELFGNLDCPPVPGFQPPIRPEDVYSIYGRNRGIQGHQNSCYLDATLFAMFSFTSIFDCLLYRPPTTQDIPEYGNVQKVLREEIVNPLRKNHFVRADKVMKLRQFLDSLTSVKGLMSEEKDPEELLNSLLSQTLKAAPFLELSPSNQTAHLYQLFVERDESRKVPPTVQELFEQSFLTSSIKLKKVPPVLILQMPRFGRQFKVYDKILPSQLLDVTDVIEDSPRQCIVCGKLAVFECLSCFGDHGTGLDSTAFCTECHHRVHNHSKRRNHKTTLLKVPDEFKQHTFPASNSRLFMELFAVVCIETSHYVSFVKCGSGPDAPWCFFDSMADRKGEMNGYNIPEVSEAREVTKWFSDNDLSFDHSENGPRFRSKLGDQTKRLVTDAYMCFYQSSDVMMYQ